MGNNLWGRFDDVIEEMNIPKEVLEEQAKYLEDSLNGLVKGQVKRKILNKSWTDFYEEIKQEYDFVYEFLILSDFVERYSYLLLTVAYGICMYPVAITVSSAIIDEFEFDYEIFDEDTIIASNEAEFQEILIKIFASKEVRQVLRGLHSIASKEYDEDDELF